MTALQPVADRLRSTLSLFASDEVGGTPAGGVSRPAASNEDKGARDRFATLASGLGLTVRVDDVGNMYARRKGTDDTALPVLIGSHLDTVVPGGRFDGILGVAIALETISLLNDAAITTMRPIEVVNWTGEEGARFPPAMLGSGVVAGMWDVEYAHARTDAAGVTLGGELSRIGYRGDSSNRVARFFASLEVHIEQGTQLEEAQADVGIVPMIRPVRWWTVRVSGAGGHAGGPGPEGRREAIVASSRMIVAARDASLNASDFKTTVGVVSAQPGSNNVIAHVVTFNLDIRSSSDRLLDERLADVKALFTEIARQEGVEVEFDLFWGMRSAPFDAGIQDQLLRIAKERGVRWAETPGHIGHDSVFLAGMGPAAMLFTRTEGGRSHCEEEYAPWEAVMATAGVFADAALLLANAETLPDPSSISR